VAAPNILSFQADSVDTVRKEGAAYTTYSAERCLPAVIGAFTACECRNVGTPLRETRVGYRPIERTATAPYRNDVMGSEIISSSLIETIL